MPKNLRGLDTVDPRLMWTDLDEYLRLTREATRQIDEGAREKERRDATPQGTPPNEEGAP